MTESAFEQYRQDFREYIAGLNLLECLKIKDESLSLRQSELLQNDLQLRIDYLREGSKSMNEELVVFQAGYNDGSINDLSQMIISCIPDNVEVFNFVDLRNGQHKGIIYKCLKDNSTKLMQFSSLYGKYKEVK